MTKKTWGVLVVSCGAMLMGFGNAAADQTGETGAPVCEPVEAARSMTPTPLQMQTLHPEC